MKKRLLPAISIGIAVIIIGSIAYAADRKKNIKTAGLTVDRIQEEETLRAELLNALEHHEKKTEDHGDKKLVAIRPDDSKEQQKPSKQRPVSQ
jgi:hypothetical protein